MRTARLNLPSLFAVPAETELVRQVDALKLEQDKQPVGDAIAIDHTRNSKDEVTTEEQRKLRVRRAGTGFTDGLEAFLSAIGWKPVYPLNDCDNCDNWIQKYILRDCVCAYAGIVEN